MMIHKSINKFWLIFLSLSTLILLALLVGKFYFASNLSKIAEQSPLAVKVTNSSSMISSPSAPAVASPVVSPIASPIVTVSPTTPTLKSAVNLAVPFTPQAPDADWSQPWQDGCEEAALLMVDAFNRQDKSTLLPASVTKQKIADMVKWQEERFGKHKDIGVDEMAIVAKEYLGYTKVTVNKEANLTQIKAELSRGKPVIVPAAGQLLNNPFFTPPGPAYHVFVITGFKGDTFIANENGTRRGRNYEYSSVVLDRALHDTVDGSAHDVLPMAYLTLE